MPDYAGRRQKLKEKPVPDDVNALLDRLCERLDDLLDADRVATARRRHADMLAGRCSDAIPMKLVKGGAGADLPDFDWAEQFHDPAKSLYMQLKTVVLPQAETDGDNVPGVRADMGVINGMTVLGAKYDVPPHTKPVINEYVPKDALAEFEVPDDVSDLGTMPRVVEHMQHHVRALADRGLGDRISVFHCDQQGPFDISAQSRGHDIFFDLYEDPDFVHALMAKAARIYIAISKVCKKINGEPLDGGLAVDYWSESGGVRMCGDSDILIGIEPWRDLVLPYVRQAYEPFGGGWYHYCGGVPGFKRAEGVHLHDLLAEVGNIRGVNWTTAGDWLAEMRKLKQLGLAHLGGLPRGDGEPLDDYFRRALSPYDDRSGMVFWAELRADEFDRAMDTWHRVQDEVLG